MLQDNNAEYKHLEEYIKSLNEKTKRTLNSPKHNSQISFFIVGFIASIYFTAISAVSTYLIILNISFFLSIIATHLQNNTANTSHSNSSDDKSPHNTANTSHSNSSDNKSPPSNYKMLISLFRLATCTTSISLSSYYIFYKICNIQSFLLGAPIALLLTILTIYLLRYIFNKEEDLIWLGKHYRDNSLAKLKSISANQLLTTIHEKSTDEAINAIEQEIIKNNTLNFETNTPKSLFYKINSKYKTALLATLFDIRLDKKTQQKPKAEWANNLRSYIINNKFLFLFELVLIISFTYIISPYSFTDKLYFLYPLLNKYIIVLQGSFAPWLTLVLLFITSIICLHITIQFLKSRAEAPTNDAKTDPEPNSEQQNPLRNNPIASIWHGTIAFFRWFYKSGIDSPITMSIYAFLFFGTIVDLYVPFLPAAWHGFNINVMFGLVNMQHTAFWFAAMITGFFLGKLFLLANYLINDRTSLYSSEEHTLETKIITATTIILILCFSLIEASSPAVLSHVGSWLVFNLITWNIKPAVILLDLVFNKEESFVYSIFTSIVAILSLKKISTNKKKSPFIVIAASLVFMSFFEIISINTLFLTTLIVVNNPKLLENAWELISEGLVSVINFPLKVIALPMLHVYIITLIKIFSFNEMHETITKINVETTKIDLLWSKFNKQVSNFINKNPKLFASIFVLTLSTLALTNIWTCPILVYIATSIPFITMPINAFNMIAIAIATITISCNKHDWSFPPPKRTSPPPYTEAPVYVRIPPPTSTKNTNCASPNSELKTN